MFYNETEVRNVHFTTFVYMYMPSGSKQRPLLQFKKNIHSAVNKIKYFCILCRQHYTHLVVTNLSILKGYISGETTTARPVLDPVSLCPGIKTKQRLLLTIASLSHYTLTALCLIHNQLFYDKISLFHHGNNTHANVSRAF